MGDDAGSRQSQAFVNCGAANNRIAIETGKIGGALWVSGFDITRDWLTVSPERDDVPASGGSGVIHVNAVPGHEWTISGVPDWIQIASGESKAAGSANVSYKVAENASNEPRSAVLTLGDAAFRVTQQWHSAVLLPYQERFNALPMPIWMCRLVMAMGTVRLLPLAERDSGLPPGRGEGPRPAAAARVAAVSASYAGRCRPEAVLRPVTGAMSLSC